VTIKRGEGGHQFVIVAGVRELFIRCHLDSWLAAMQAKFADRVQKMFAGRVRSQDYTIRTRI
jgi:hypothetical protein